MRFGLKLAAGAAAAGLLPLLHPGAAGAAAQGSDSGSESISFRSVGGQSLTCGVTGMSSYLFADQLDSTTFIDASTQASDDPGCRAALNRIVVVVDYETSPGSGEFASSSATASPAANVHLRVPGPTGPITVDHIVEFRCQDNFTGICGASFQTSPK
jgi:hypothetical protein